jgi:hypothetical protein
MPQPVSVLLPQCIELQDSPEHICIQYEDAMRLRAVPNRRVLVRVVVLGTLLPIKHYEFDLEDVCMAGRRSESGKCWCIPADKAL